MRSGKTPVLAELLKFRRLCYVFLMSPEIFLAQNKKYVIDNETFNYSAHQVETRLHKLPCCPAGGWGQKSSINHAKNIALTSH